MKQQDLKPALIDMGFEIGLIPKELYKYSGCTEEDKEKKLKALREKNIWLCCAKYLNDPFEGLSLYIDQHASHRYGWKQADVTKLYKVLKSLGENMLIGSFADSGLKEDMPLWAHYAQDHRGYCLQYEVIDNHYIYPVIYQSKRHLANETLSCFLKDIQNHDYEKDSVERFLVIWSSFMIKHTVWQYEKEYRVLKYEMQKPPRSESGRYVTEEELGLRLKAVYIGEKCSCRKELMEVGLKRGCEVYQMGFNPFQEEFKLTPQKVAVSP